MRLLKSFFYDFKNVFTIDDKLIVILAASLFLPFPITVVTILGIGIYVLVKSDFRSNLRSVKRSYILLLFALYLMVTSLVSGNYLGLALAFGMLFLFIVVIYYRKYIHKELFEIILDVMIIMSIICVVVAIGEQFYYLNTVEKMSSFFDIQNKPAHRVHTFFFNANYYAMMIAFIEVVCIYKYITIPKAKKRIEYVLAGLLNLFALFLTGGRLGWLCIALAVLIMILVNRWYKTFIAACAGIGVGVGVLSMKPGLIPRLAEKGLDIGRRARIYEAAQMMMKDTWMFGRGPLTYYYCNADYYDAYVSEYGSSHLNKLGIDAPHSHSMFLEPFISFGVIGSVIIGWYLISQVKRMIRLFTRKVDIALGSLILGFIVVTITFCIIDFPIFWVQTGGLFLLVLGSSDMYKKEVE
ncbi:glucan phosphoethanolaminetransferase (alkaline phosphatase superfamily) [Breznakia sp. PF5-3]|uniref:O-antigen ligase family protein n=1 Tax=unclassified Breznakia TaxID=2623764 RepID=UPI002406C486|nr:MULTISPECIES: O-antigen ligase family protein [unclassified Breznakia]MDF9824957.1 glucan phosphoethanolaminetransferase (alkaline phosphatase superfamily) [Breznakia sp. PM6-1]MDF9835775.1 glucan phosphoethanolaminetransferase (alkaline phosphatase superfamily) [Breznakia sp. PF5-3]MDF9837931.1 glucan phosphoethanolaminetransferase (alkaline phosphatase superfamily) [Breznakia sp. PFB2-8]MDF9859920.1 glucan phosphoethanolaminetransferase (alkaline phosphatase superfamily) [Breznakia sp. PH5